MKKFLQYVHPGVQINFRFSSLLIKLCRAWDGKFEVEGKVYPWFSFTWEHKEIESDYDSTVVLRYINGWTLTLPYIYILFLRATKDVKTVTVPESITVEGFWTFQDQQKQFVKAKTPLVLHVDTETTDKYVLVTDEALGIDIVTKGNPAEEIEGELDFLWQNYALCPDADLDEHALVVKKNLLERFQ